MLAVIIITARSKPALHRVGAGVGALLEKKKAPRIFPPKAASDHQPAAGGTGTDHDLARNGGQSRRTSIACPHCQRTEKNIRNERESHHEKIQI